MQNSLCYNQQIMIGFLKGKIELLQRPFVIIDVNGVGYKVLVPESVYAKLITRRKNQNFYLYLCPRGRLGFIRLFGSRGFRTYLKVY